MRNDILSRLRTILVEDLQVSPDVIHDDAHFRTDLRLDSLSLVDFVFLVQKDFGFKAEMEEFRDARTMGTLADVILTKIESPSR